MRADTLLLPAPQPPAGDSQWKGVLVEEDSSTTDQEKRLLCPTSPTWGLLAEVERRAEQSPLHPSSVPGSSQPQRLPRRQQGPKRWRQTLRQTLSSPGSSTPLWQAGRPFSARLCPFWSLLKWPGFLGYRTRSCLGSSTARLIHGQRERRSIQSGTCALFLIAAQLICLRACWREACKLTPQFQQWVLGNIKRDLLNCFVPCTIRKRNELLSKYKSSPCPLSCTRVRFLSPAALAT